MVSSFYPLYLQYDGSTGRRDDSSKDGRVCLTKKHAIPFPLYTYIPKYPNYPATCRPVDLSTCRPVDPSTCHKPKNNYNLKIRFILSFLRQLTVALAICRPVDLSTHPFPVNRLPADLSTHPHIQTTQLHIDKQTKMTIVN